MIVRGGGKRHAPNGLSKKLFVRALPDPVVKGQIRWPVPPAPEWVAAQRNISGITQ
jgi:hypothetical protein